MDLSKNNEDVSDQVGAAVDPNLMQKMINLTLTIGQGEFSDVFPLPWSDVFILITFFVIFVGASLLHYCHPRNRGDCLRRHRSLDP